LLRGVLKARSPELFRLTVLVLVLACLGDREQDCRFCLGPSWQGWRWPESPMRTRRWADILPFRDTFLAVFFVSIGMLVDLHLVADSWPLILGVCLGLSLLKALAAGGAALLSAYPLRIAVICGLLLFQVGEFSFILLKQALALNLLSAAVYQTTLAVIALTMVATPLLARHAPTLAAALATRFGWRNEPELREETGNLEGHVIIAGYGLSGRNLGSTARDAHPYLHVELNGNWCGRDAMQGLHPLWRRHLVGGVGGRA
jgi:CPA2 family monovalent cation:H+ antiporter-2